MNDISLTKKEELIVRLGSDPRLAHQVLFSHRHPNDTPDFHFGIIDIWHNPRIKRAVVQAFRGAGKSTIAEEAIIIQALLRQYHNGIILGETYERAVERLRAIKHEFENNSIIEELFGSMVGPTWAEGKIVLSSGIIIQAFGRGQSLRGSKHLDYRPDRAFGDDVENEESCQTKEAISKTMDWLVAVVLPALDPSYIIRINGTPLHPEAMICRLEKDSGWTSKKYPIRYRGDSGSLVASWPSRFSLLAIDEIEQTNYRLGKGDKFMQEYMCEAEDPAIKPFKSADIRVEPIVRIWHPVYSIYDPARSTKATSATTGVIHASWVGNKIVIWDAYGKRWQPSEIIDDIFRSNETYSPVLVGVEADGLKEFILQPLRQEQIKRGYSIPIRELQAPRDRSKDNFIRALQPFFNAKEIIFAKPCPEAEAQLLAYPSGDKDIPNALAYMLTLRPGQVIYEEFNNTNINVDILILRHDTFYLCLNAKPAYVTGILLQFTRKGNINVLADWIYEGDTSSRLAEIVASARLATGLSGSYSLRPIAGPSHFTRHATSGLAPTARQIPIDLLRGGAEIDGREQIRKLIVTNKLHVSSKAHWTLNAFQSGYAREITKAGVLTDFAVDNIYKTLIEGLETWAANMVGANDSDDLSPSYATTSDGRRYISSRASNYEKQQPSKSSWTGINIDGTS